MDVKIIDNNKKAFHDYFIEETYEAGVVLTGVLAGPLMEAVAGVAAGLL